jgi:hypothetical protein
MGIRIAVVAWLFLACTLSAEFERRRAARLTIIPVGRWRVEFANGVVETCEIRHDRSAYVSEPRRNSPGTARVKDGATIVLFQDNRAERWKLDGNRWLVEHWCPSAECPNGVPVVGVAERIR